MPDGAQEPDKAVSITSLEFYEGTHQGRSDKVHHENSDDGIFKSVHFENFNFICLEIPLY